MLYSDIMQNNTQYDHAQPVLRDSSNFLFLQIMRTHILHPPKTLYRETEER